MVVLQAKGVQTEIGPGRQTPVPSQTRVPVISPPWQVPGVQTVAEEAEAVAAAPDAAPVPADEVPAVVAAEADADAQPTAQGEHRTEA